MADIKTKTTETETVETKTVEESTENETQVLEPLFFYPKEGMTVKAKTREEADKLLAQKLKESDNG